MTYYKEIFEQVNGYSFCLIFHLKCCYSSGINLNSSSLIEPFAFCKILVSITKSGAYLERVQRVSRTSGFFR